MDNQLKHSNLKRSINIDINDDILYCINQLRKNPKLFIPILEEQKRFIQYGLSKNPPIVQTYEGVAAYDKAIEFLQSQKPVNEVKMNVNLCNAARDLVNDIGPKGLLGHLDSKKRNVSDRVEQYTEWDHLCLESIEVSGISGNEVIVDLLVDDGVESKGDRYNLLNPNVKYIGVASGPHKVYENINVIILVGDIRKKGKLYYDYNNYKYNFNDKKEIKKKVENDYQIVDPDAPNNTIGMSIKNKIKEFNKKKVLVVKKCYKLSNENTHIVEIEEF